MYPCSADNCDGSFPNRPELIKHWARLHHDKVLMHYCPVNKCTFQAISPLKIIKHLKSKQHTYCWRDAASRDRTLAVLKLPQELIANKNYRDPLRGTPPRGFLIPKTHPRAAKAYVKTIPTVHSFWRQAGKDTPFYTKAPKTPLPPRIQSSVVQIHKEETVTRSTHQTPERSLKVEEEDQIPVPIMAWDIADETLDTADETPETAEPAAVAEDESLVVSDPTISNSEDSATLVHEAVEELTTPALQPVIPMEALEEVEKTKDERKALYEKIEELSSMREAGLLARIATLEADLQKEREESAALRARIATLEKEEDVLMDFDLFPDFDLTFNNI